MSITTILFDFGGVIHTPLDPSAVAARRERLAALVGFPDASAMWFRFYASEEWERTKTGAMTDAEMWSALLSPRGLESPAEQRAFVGELYDGVGLEPSLKQLIADLKQQYKVGILSNASDILESLLRDVLGIIGYFDAVVNSHRIGVAKPDPEAYVIALERLGSAPGEVLFIDDQERNTVAAEAQGIRSHLFVGVPGLIEELEGLSLLR